VLLLASIGAGLALGLTLLGTSLPLDPLGRSVPLWLDVAAAAVAAAPYPVYFNMPYRLIAWLVVGAVAHGLRWWAMSVWNWNIATGAFVACLLVGTVLAPVAHRRRIPFAGVGFAAVVALVPGVFVFRLVDALSALPFHRTSTELVGAISDGTTAVLIISTMAVGLVIPLRATERLSTDRRRRTRTAPCCFLPA
jgi:uncharacterized membrane protein YjjB (DUF3815 family)